MLVQRITIIAAPFAALVVACTAFGVASPSDTGDDPDATPPISDGSSEELPSLDGGGGDAADPCSGATFCETFDTGSIEEMAARWGKVENIGGLAIVTEGGRRALESRLKVGDQQARLQHVLGEIAAATEVTVRAVVKALSPTGTYELFTLDLFKGNDSAGDYAVQSKDGKLTVDDTTTATTVADGQWHTIDVRITAAEVSFVIDGKESGRQATSRSSASFLLAAGAYTVSPLSATVRIDFIRVDVKP